MKLSKLQTEAGKLKSSPNLCFLISFLLKRRWWVVMRIIMLIIIVVTVFLYLGLGFWASGNATSEERNMSYGISTMIDKMRYSVGESIMMTLKIFNYTQEDIVFYFNTSQRYDFIVEDEEGNEVWSWSKDMMFAMALGEETLGPINTEVIFTEEYKGKLSQGYYKITGVFIAQDRAMSGGIIIEVK